MDRIKLREPANLDFAPEQPGVVSRMVRLHLENFGYSASDLAKTIHANDNMLNEYYDLNSTRTEKDSQGTAARYFGAKRAPAVGCASAQPRGFSPRLWDQSNIPRGVERSERNVSIDNIARIARGLRVSASELLKE
jgi:hypothetical protein